MLSCSSEPLTKLTVKSLREMATSTKYLLSSAKTKDMGRFQSTLKELELRLTDLAKPISSLIESNDFNLNNKKVGQRFKRISDQEDISQRPLAGFVASRISNLTRLHPFAARDLIDSAFSVGYIFEILDSIIKFKKEIDLSDKSPFHNLKNDIEATFQRLLDFAKEVLEDDDYRYADFWAKRMFSPSHLPKVCLSKLMEIYRMLRFEGEYSELTGEYQNAQAEPRRFENFVNKLKELLGISTEQNVKEFLTESSNHRRLLEALAIKIK